MNTGRSVRTWSGWRLASAAAHSENADGAALAAVVFLALFLVQMGLPPLGFFSGDCGVKYLTVRAVMERGPLDPTIDYPARDIDPTFAGRNIFLVQHGERLVSLFPPVLPTLAAGCVSLFGLRGLYIVPALGAVLAAWAVRRLAARSVGRKAAFAAGLGTAFGTPVFFYGLEFWEHAPAAGLVAVAAVLAWPNDEHAALRHGRDLAAGALLGLAVAFRLEAALAGPALYLARCFVVLRESDPGPRRREALTATARASIVAAASALALLVPVALWNWAIFGQSIPPQVAFNLGISNSFHGRLVQMIQDNVLPRRGGGLFVGLIVCGLATTFELRRRGRARPSRWFVAATIATWFAFAFALPAFDMLHGRGFGDSFGYRSAAHTWVFLAALLWAVVWTPRRATRGPHAPWVPPAVAGLIFVVAVSLAAPVPGGFQWGARLLLPAAPLLLLAAVLAFDECHKRAVRGVAAALLLFSCAVQLGGVAFLVHVKGVFDGLTRSLAAATSDGEVIVTDLPWLAQVAARLYDRRRFVSVTGDAELRALAGLIGASGRVSAATVPGESAWSPPRTLDVNGTQLCRDEGRTLSTRGLVLWRYAPASPAPRSSGGTP